MFKHITIKKVQNGWLVTYTDGNLKEFVFLSVADMLGFFNEELNK